MAIGVVVLRVYTHGSRVRFNAEWSWLPLNTYKDDVIKQLHKEYVIRMTETFIVGNTVACKVLNMRPLSAVLNIPCLYILYSTPVQVLH